MRTTAARRADRRRAALSGAVLVVTFLLAGPVPAHAQSAPCSASAIVGNRLVDTATLQSWRSPLPVQADGVLDVIVRAPGATSVSLGLEFAGVTWSVPVTVVGANQAGSVVVQVPVHDYARFGVGLYHVVVSTDTCSADAWIDVQGRSPLSTPAGLGGVLLALVGVGLLITGAVRAHRGRKGLAPSIVGGVLAGWGGLVLSQQFGVVPATPFWASLWTVAPGTLGAVVNRLSGEAAKAAAPHVQEATPPEEDWSGATEAEPPPPPPTLPSETANGGTKAEPSSPPPSTPPADEGDPARTVFARLDAPPVVVAEEPVEVTVGIAPTPSPGVAGGPMVRPFTSVGAYTLAVQVVADGFTLADAGASWRHDLAVSTDVPYPTFTIRLTAERQLERVKPRTIQAIYAIDGQTIGMAVRALAVVRSADLAGEAAPPPEAPGVDIAVPTDRTAPDLTVRILQSDAESEGRLLWTFETSVAGVPVPDAPVASDIGDHPDAFTQKLVQQVGQHEGQPELFSYLRGVARSVADVVPDAFWDILRAVAAQVHGRPPTLLVLSEEPYVPWELAAVEPPLDASLPAILCAQVSVGRWVLGHRRPKLPPPVEVDVQTLAVVWGVYDRQEWRLVEAEHEAADLQASFGATSVEATAVNVLDCLQGTPAAQVVHFAVHGLYNPAGPKEGLILVDGRTLDPMVVKGTEVAGAPLVFLNACQVGSGSRLLGDYAGMAEAFLYAGAAAVVAPLWSIDDAVARQVADRFYQRALVEGAPPADVFREERAHFVDDGTMLSSTYLAYQFFGHPTMRLVRTGSGTGGGASPGT